MGIFNRIAELQIMHDIAYGEPRDLQPYRDEQHMLATAIDPRGRYPFLFDRKAERSAYLKDLAVLKI